MNFRFSIATQKDDSDIRKLMASIPMKGSLTAAFEREPDYFLGCSTMGRDSKVLIAREQKSGRLAMTGCTAVADRFINGKVQPVGYVGQLRVDLPFQGLMLPARGAAFLRKTQENVKTDLWFSVIADQNETARAIFIDNQRKPFPVMHKAAGIRTLGIILKKKRREHPAGCSIAAGSPENIEGIAAFLDKWGREKQFFPAYTKNDFLDDELTRSFSIGDFRILVKNNRIAGVAGLWDQSSYKQTVIREYHGILKYGRPVYNLWAPLLGFPPLPGKGEKLKSACISFICIEQNDPALFLILLKEMYTCACERGFHYLMAGFSENDPLLSVAEKFLHFSYHSSLYTFSMKEQKNRAPVLDERVPYIEIAGL